MIWLLCKVSVFCMECNPWANFYFTANLYVLSPGYFHELKWQTNSFIFMLMLCCYSRNHWVAPTGCWLQYEERRVGGIVIRKDVIALVCLLSGGCQPRDHHFWLCWSSIVQSTSISCSDILCYAGQWLSVEVLWGGGAGIGRKWCMFGLTLASWWIYFIFVILFQNLNTLTADIMPCMQILDTKLYPSNQQKVMYVHLFVIWFCTFSYCLPKLAAVFM